MKKLSDLSKKEFKMIYDALGSDANVARHLNISRQAVSKFKKKNGISSYKEGLQKRNDRILYRYNDGESVDRISKIMNISIPHVYRILRKEKRRLSNTII